MSGTSAAQVADVAEVVLRQTLAREPTLGSSRLLCLDGPAGSGKTTLARAVLAVARDQRIATALVHMDDLYPGWDGLDAVTPLIEQDLLRPLARGTPGRYRRWDWAAERFTETRTVAPTPLLVLEGVASGARAYADLVTLLVWVTAPRDLRLHRGLERDGVALRDRLETWLVDEARMFRRERTRARADVIVDGTGAAAPLVRQGRSGGPQEGWSRS